MPSDKKLPHDPVADFFGNPAQKIFGPEGQRAATSQLQATLTPLTAQKREPPAGPDFLRLLQDGPLPPGPPRLASPTTTAQNPRPTADHEAARPTDIKVFVSHSEKDEPVARALVDFLEDCLGFTHGIQMIRCTSLADYDYPAGDRQAELMRKEATEAPVFLALVSEDAVKSSWVLFELGARWGRDTRLIPIIHPHATVKVLPSVIDKTKAVHLKDGERMVKLAEDIGRIATLPLASRTKLNRAEKLLANFVAALPNVAVLEESSTGEEAPVAGGETSTPAKPVLEIEDIIDLLTSSELPPRRAADALIGDEDPAQVLPRVLEAQRAFIMDLRPPTPLEAMAFDGEPPWRDRAVKVVARVCERVDDNGAGAFRDAVATLAREKQRKGNVIGWHFREAMDILAMQVELVFGKDAGWTAFSILLAWMHDEELRSRMNDLLPPDHDEPPRPGGRRKVQRA